MFTLNMSTANVLFECFYSVQVQYSYLILYSHFYHVQCHTTEVIVNVTSDADSALAPSFMPVHNVGLELFQKKKTTTIPDYMT